MLTAFLLADYPPLPSAGSPGRVQVEDLFQAMQKATTVKKSAGRQKLAVLDLKRATAVGIRMSRLRYHPPFPPPTLGYLPCRWAWCQMGLVS